MNLPSVTQTGNLNNSVTLHAKQGIIITVAQNLGVNQRRTFTMNNDAITESSHVVASVDYGNEGNAFGGNPNVTVGQPSNGSIQFTIKNNDTESSPLEEPVKITFTVL